MFFASALFGANVKLESLPPALQTAIKENTRDATVTSISSEKENGRVQYEVESKRNGKGHNLVFDKSGALLETEAETDLDSVPSAAKAAIQIRAAGGTITMVEKLTAGNNVSYEATIKTKAGKSTEYAANADGTPHKER